jgi:hypothetical protein
VSSRKAGLGESLECGDFGHGANCHGKPGGSGGLGKPGAHQEAASTMHV